jgi:ribosomal protein S6--L-glutamate ligase
VNITILGNEGSWYVEDLQRAAEGRGHRCWRVDFHRLASSVVGMSTGVACDESSLSEMDAVLVRTMPPGSLEQVVYRMDVLGRLEASGVQVMNSPRAIECAVDKFLTTSRLAAAGLPVPRTVVCEESEQALEAFHFLGGDVVVKPLFGSEGRGILRVCDPDLAFRTFRTLERIDAVLYVQEFIPHAGYDIRVLVLDGEIVGAIRRTGAGRGEEGKRGRGEEEKRGRGDSMTNALFFPPSPVPPVPAEAGAVAPGNGLPDFRTNIARQGIAEKHHPTDLEADFSLRAAAAVQARFAGVDLLYGPDGRAYVLEVNAVPGWRAFGQATGIDVADRVIASLEGF